MISDDKTKQPTKADASLYNEHPYDTSSSCPSASVPTCTSSISCGKDDVSVESIPAENKKWFVLRASYGRAVKAKTFIEAKGMECYVPMRYKEMVKSGKMLIVTEPLLPSFVFVHAALRQVGALLHDSNIKVSGCKSLLSYYYDHTSFREDAPSKNPPLAISDSAMDNFIKLTSIKNSHIIPVTSENIKYKLGDEVVVVEGEFMGVHGRVARIAGQQRVVVELFDGCLVATAYIPTKVMRLYAEH